MQNPKQPSAASAKKQATALAVISHEGGAKRIKSEELFQQINEVEIDHGGRIYRLRITQLNKLILTA